VSNALAIACGILLLYEFFWPVVIALVAAAGLYMVWENLGEIWR